MILWLLLKAFLKGGSLKDTQQQISLKGASTSSTPAMQCSDINASGDGSDVKNRRYEQNNIHMALGQNRYPTWNFGTWKKHAKTCGPNPGGSMLTHTDIPRPKTVIPHKKERHPIGAMILNTHLETDKERRGTKGRLMTGHVRRGFGEPQICEAGDHECWKG